MAVSPCQLAPTIEFEGALSAPQRDFLRNRVQKTASQLTETSVHELRESLSPDLQDELTRLTPPFHEDGTPSDSELRIAQAQLVGWLEGLFHGIQTALFAQQMAARAQLEEMRRRALPAGSAPPGGPQPSGPYL